MVAPRLRSRTFGRKYVKTPGGRLVIHRIRRKPARATCASCGEFLLAVPQAQSSAMKRMTLTQKRPQRPYGGERCSACTRILMKQKARSQ